MRKWTRIEYDDIDWKNDEDEETTGYGVIAYLDGDNGLRYQCALYPSAGIGNDWLAWTILLNGKTIFTSDPDFNTVAEATRDCEYKCGLQEVLPYEPANDGWH